MNIELSLKNNLVDQCDFKEFLNNFVRKKGSKCLYFIHTCMSIFGSVEATEKFYDCNVYTNEENIPTESTYCVNDILDNKFYCKSWECEALDCPLDQQLPQKGDDCSICPGIVM